jgi:hypothetical protein
VHAFRFSYMVNAQRISNLWVSFFHSGQEVFTLLKCVVVTSIHYGDDAGLHFWPRIVGSQGEDNAA